MIRGGLTLILLSLFFIAQFDVMATSYSSTGGGGDWTNSASWSGSAPPVSNINNDQININGGDIITRNGSLSINNSTTFNVNSGGTLIITGSLSVNNGLTLNINGTLIIQGGLSTNNGASITVNGGGSVVVQGASTFDQNANLIVNSNGNLDFQSDVALGQNATITVNSNGSMSVDGSLSLAGNADVTVDGVLDITNDLVFSSTPKEFNGNGTVNVGGSGCSSWNGTGSCNGFLPVTLVSFNIIPVEDRILISWSTASELNNDYFTIERSKDGINYHTLGQVQGHGTTSQPQDYEFIDERPLSGTSYYRLKQTDFDGTTETFRPVSIHFEGNSEDVVLYPNPVLGNDLNFSVFNFKPNQDFSIRISDINGRVVSTNQYKTNEFGFSENLLDVSNLPHGSYIVNFINGYYSQFFKIIKN